jgi:hypothetical protein
MLLPADAESKELGQLEADSIYPLKLLKRKA